MRSSLYTLISLAAAMSLGLAACTGGGQADPSQSPSADGSSAPAEGESPGKTGEEDKAKASTQAEAEQAPEQLVKKDLATWALPSDTYLYTDMLLYHQGQQVALKKCLAEKQIAIEVPTVTYDPAQAQELQVNTRQLATFTPEYAQAHGYRPPLVVEGNRAFQDFMSTFATKGDLDQTLAISQCIIDQNTQYPFLNPLPPVDKESEAPGEAANPEETQTNILNDNTAMALATAKQPAVQEAAVKWRECMAPLGIPDLPQNPQLMPPVSKGMEWFANGPLFGGEPVEEERQVAVHDSQCRASSNYTEQWYNALYDAYAEDIKVNKDRYLERQALMKQRENELKQFISEHQ